MLRADAHDKSSLIDPLFRAHRYYWTLLGCLMLMIVWGVVMYIHQVQKGLVVTGMDRPVYWGLYMVNFVFFIGISLAGTFTSAILRITGVEWRRPITRLAEGITVFALIIAMMQIIIDMGRPNRLLYVFLYGRFQSPILWDVMIVNVYLMTSAIYLYLPLIPDAAIIRDNMPPTAARWHRLLYTVLAAGWRGTVEQWRRLEKVVALLAILIIPIAISVHTITSWLLATTVQPGWHSTVFGPYFVVTAIFSGISAIFLVMTIVRATMGLQEYITYRQYRGLSWLFVTMAIVWGYFTYTETLTLVAGQQMVEFTVLASKLWGTHAFTFWMMLGLIGAAFYIVLSSLLIPSRLIRVAMLQPKAAVLAGMLSAILIVLLSDTASPGAPPEPFGLRTLGWALVVFFACVAALGVGVWFKKHPISATVIGGICVLIGTWTERWNIVVPTLTHPRMIQFSTYRPTETEIIISLASLALFVFMAVVFFKIVPPVSIWEVAEGRVVHAAYEKVHVPIPEPSSREHKKARWLFR